MHQKQIISHAQGPPNETLDTSRAYFMKIGDGGTNGALSRPLTDDVLKGIVRHSRYLDERLLV